VTGPADAADAADEAGADDHRYDDRYDHRRDAATVVARPRPQPPAATQTSLGAISIGASLDALERDERLRTRKFCFIALGLSAMGVIGPLTLPGDPAASALMLVACLAAPPFILFLLHRTRDPLEFRRPSTALGWLVPAMAVNMAIPYFGAFSPAPIIIVLGTYFLGLGRSRWLAVAAYALGATAQATVALLVIMGATRDTGLIKVPGLSARDQLIGQGLVQLVLLATFLVARLSRRTTETAMGELERAVRVAAHREALLHEAREELERALRSGRGRFTDQTLGVYQLGAVIGRGAMGEVYEAVDPRTGERVAVKLLSQASLGNPQHVLRFLRELRTAAEIASPHVVRVIEVGEQPVPHLVMERLEGKTLADILRGTRALAPREVAELIAQVGAGVAAAAAAGVVHRDLKPHNLFRHGPVWKILDFGIARAIDASDTLTAGHVVGTPSYMAPEQASGGTVDHQSDLYALAAIAYRALTGHPPFAAGELAETLYRVVHTRPRRPTELAHELPAAVDLVLAVGLAKRPADRFASAAAFAAALAAALELTPDASSDVGSGISSDRTLDPEIRTRGEALVRQGAWSSSSRAATSS